MVVNNEIGVIQLMVEVVWFVYEVGGLLYLDVIQVFGKIFFNIKILGVDFVIFFVYKIGGFKGIGVLVVVEGIVGLELLLCGGGQEQGCRVGMENVVGIVGFGVVVRCVFQVFLEDVVCMIILRIQLENGFWVVFYVMIFLGDVERLLNIILFMVFGFKGEIVVIGFDFVGIVVFLGLVCLLGKVQLFYVLLVMGFDLLVVQGVVWFSLGWFIGLEDINWVLEVW